MFYRFTYKQYLCIAFYSFMLLGIRIDLVSFVNFFSYKQISENLKTCQTWTIGNS